MSTEVRRYAVSICDLCVVGQRGECRTPGCVFWRKTPPGVRLLDSNAIEDLQEHDDKQTARDIGALSREVAEIRRLITARGPVDDAAVRVVTFAWAHQDERRIFTTDLPMVVTHACKLAPTPIEKVMVLLRDGRYIDIEEPR